MTHVNFRHTIPLPQIEQKSFEHINLTKRVFLVEKCLYLRYLEYNIFVLKIRHDFKFAVNNGNTFFPLKENPCTYIYVRYWHFSTSSILKNIFSFLFSCS